MMSRTRDAWLAARSRSGRGATAWPSWHPGRPGGGVAARRGHLCGGERPPQAAASRELAEETGILAGELGPCLWARETRGRDRGVLPVQGIERGIGSRLVAQHRQQVERVLVFGQPAGMLALGLHRVLCGDDHVLQWQRVQQRPEVRDLVRLAGRHTRRSAGRDRGRGGSSTSCPAAPRPASPASRPRLPRWPGAAARKPGSGKAAGPTRTQERSRSATGSAAGSACRTWASAPRTTAST